MRFKSVIVGLTAALAIGAAEAAFDDIFKSAGDLMKTVPGATGGAGAGAVGEDIGALRGNTVSGSCATRMVELAPRDGGDRRFRTGRWRRRHPLDRR